MEVCEKKGPCPVLLPCVSLTPRLSLFSLELCTGVMHTKSGRIDVDGVFKISAHGLSYSTPRTPDPNASTPARRKSMSAPALLEKGKGKGRGKKGQGGTFLELCEVGAGNGGCVYKAMHLPSMKVVALKKVPLHNTARYDSSAQDTSSHHKQTHGAIASKSTPQSILPYM